MAHQRGIPAVAHVAAPGGRGSAVGVQSSATASVSQPAPSKIAAPKAKTVLKGSQQGNVRRKSMDSKDMVVNRGAGVKASPLRKAQLLKQSQVVMIVMVTYGVNSVS